LRSQPAILADPDVLPGRPHIDTDRLVRRREDEHQLENRIPHPSLKRKRLVGGEPLGRRVRVKEGPIIGSHSEDNREDRNGCEHDESRSPTGKGRGIRHQEPRQGRLSLLPTQSS
jgi:hypothetical protein